MKKKYDDGQLSLFPDDAFELPQPKTVPAKQLKKEKIVVRPAELPVEDDVQDHTLLFQRLAQSAFRSGFHLGAAQRTYIEQKGWTTIRQHAADFVAKRLAPANIPNDGRQTPMRGHPVFLAQHATGCCCRGCFCKWHHIPAGRALTPEEQRYAVGVLMAWLHKEYEKKD